MEDDSIFTYSFSNKKNFQTKNNATLVNSNNITAVLN